MEASRHRRGAKRPEKGRELRAAAAQLDIPWARTSVAGVARENFMRFVLNPMMDYYTRRRTTGREKLAALKGPVILVANHASHIDTPVILSALPRRLRKRTAVAAAADYFYRNRLVAWLVSLIFNTVPIDRKGGGGLSKNGSHLDTLLDQGWSLLLYPEGTRSRSGGTGPGAARRGRPGRLAQPLDRPDPRHRHRAGDAAGAAVAQAPARDASRSKRHRITVSFGEPILPTGDTTPLIERVQSFFENGDGGPSASVYRRPRLTGAQKD